MLHFKDLPRFCSVCKEDKQHAVRWPELSIWKLVHACWLDLSSAVEQTLESARASSALLFCRRTQVGPK